jgi:hypothetical protein
MQPSAGRPNGGGSPGAPGPGRPQRQGAPQHVFRGDIARFAPHELRAWRGGQWRQTSHGGRYGWWWVVDGGWYNYPSPVYPYPDYVTADYYEGEYAAPYDPSAPSYSPYGSYAPAAPGPSYYCDYPPGYYPYVQNCSYPWRAVPPQRPPY